MNRLLWWFIMLFLVSTTIIGAVFGEVLSDGTNTAYTVSSNGVATTDGTNTAHVVDQNGIVAGDGTNTAIVTIQPILETVQTASGGQPIFVGSALTGSSLLGSATKLAPNPLLLIGGFCLILLFFCWILWLLLARRRKKKEQKRRARMAADDEDEDS